MNANDSQNLILSGLQDFGLSVLSILGIVIVMMVGYLVFKWGVRQLKYQEHMYNVSLDKMEIEFNNKEIIDYNNNFDYISIDDFQSKQDWNNWQNSLKNPNRPI